MRNLLLLTFLFMQLHQTLGQTETCKNELQQILNKTVDQSKIFGTTFALKKDSFVWEGAAGNIGLNQAYFIASTTKLFTTAILLKFLSEGQISLDDKISKYLESAVLKGLHVFKGKEYSYELSIKQLLAHTSGLPDYFQDKGPNGKSLEQELKEGNDQFWGIEEVLVRTKNMKPLFAPGTKGKAHYSDANFQLLGKIIEVVSGKTYEENCQEHILKPLGLTNTYLYTNPSDSKPKALYYEAAPLNIPKAMCSFGADGGMVSTNQDMLLFIEAFFTGKIFPKEYLNWMQKWNKIFFPMQSGVGLHLFKLPWIFNPTGAVPSFIGHSGLSGALAYYSPKDNIFIVGTVNQIAHPDMSFKTMIKLIIKAVGS
jgi:CubicO group peptidase (beta-lactamase class C family)